MDDDVNDIKILCVASLALNFFIIGWLFSSSCAKINGDVHHVFYREYSRKKFEMDSGNNNED